MSGARFERKAPELSRDPYADYDEVSLAMLRQIEEEAKGDEADGEDGQQKLTLTKEQIEHFRDAYNIFDKDGDGGVTVHELAHVMRCLGQDPNDSEVRRMFSEVDADGSGEISFDEFLLIMQSQMNANSKAEVNKEFTRDDWEHAFKIFDLNNDGLISAEELGKVLSNMGENLKPFELEEMIQAASKGKSLQLDLDAFIDVMVNGLPDSNPLGPGRG